MASLENQHFTVLETCMKCSRAFPADTTYHEAHSPQVLDEWADRLPIVHASLCSKDNALRTLCSTISRTPSRIQLRSCVVQFSHASSCSQAPRSSSAITSHFLRIPVRPVRGKRVPQKETDVHPAIARWAGPCSRLPSIAPLTTTSMPAGNKRHASEAGSQAGSGSQPALRVP